MLTYGKHGINYTLFERDTEDEYLFNTRDWGM